ncbi:hypothetical protein BJH92_10750 [Paenibacillus polymyxa]|nr:hypothetical protein BJH92_10750 [Paenibacillus polymyxa]MCJ1222032.1 DUF2750 domain-containing protein [Paenibacillus polymyxa]
MYDDGWVMTSDNNGDLLVPFWPKREFAEYCAYEEWSSCTAEIIPLNTFISELLPKIKEAQYKPSIFWNRENAAALEINALLKDLEQELKQY